MKKILLIITVLLVAAPALRAQLSASEKLYAGLEGAEGVTILTLSQDIIDLVDMTVDEETKQVTGPLQKVKLMICNEANGSSAIGSVLKTMRSRPYKEIAEEDIEDTDSRVFVLRSGKRIKECHIIDHNEGKLIMLSFYGYFKVEDIDKFKQKADDIR